MQYEKALIEELLSAGYSLRAIAHNCGVSVATMDRVMTGKAKAIRPGTRYFLNRLVDAQRAGASAYELPPMLTASGVAKVIRDLVQGDLNATGLLHMRA